MNDRCRKIRSLFDRFLDDDLPRTDMTSVEEHLKECPECGEALRDEREIITKIMHLPELECPEEVLLRIEGATREREKTAAPVGFLRTTFDALNRRTVSVVVAATVIILLLVVPPFPEQRAPAPARLSSEEALKARNIAKWSLLLAAARMRQQERNVVEEVLGEYLPGTVRNSIRSSAKTMQGGLE